MKTEAKMQPVAVANRAEPSATTPPITNALDAETDLEVLRSVPKQFAITDDVSANWLIRKIISARQYGDHVRGWAEKELRRAEREEQTLMFLFGRQLEAWAKAEIEALPNRKSLALPAGVVGFRTVASKLVVDDEKKLLLWAHENCADAVVTLERLAKSVIDEMFKQTGELPDGAHVEPAIERFFVVNRTNS